MKLSEEQINEVWQDLIKNKIITPQLLYYLQVFKSIVIYNI